MSAYPLSFLPLFMIFITSLLISSTFAGNHQLGWIPSQFMCRGTIAECLAGEEFAVDSESNRRVLATTNYISYRALKRNTVPCSRPGASYYNCRPGAQANAYRRGCSTITRCRG